jgi:hypothetical protein
LGYATVKLYLGSSPPGIYVIGWLIEKRTYRGKADLRNAAGDRQLGVRHVWEPVSEMQGPYLGLYMINARPSPPAPLPRKGEGSLSEGGQ